jgi:hypothetical protein
VAVFSVVVGERVHSAIDTVWSVEQAANSEDVDFQEARSSSQ